jgi:hypothetical protein
VQPVFRAALNRGTALILAAAIVVSIVSFLFFFSRGMTNNYGDGVARVNIARKVVDCSDDSLWQRYIQIGSPWLPLQTVLMLPLVSIDSLWRSGVAGSVVSMLAFVIAVVGMYLLSRDCFGAPDGLHPMALPALSAGTLTLNPSLIYMQTTPMTEPLYMATLVAAVLTLYRWGNLQKAHRLIVAGVCMLLAELTRYEAWPVFACAAVVVALRSTGGVRGRLKNTMIFFSIGAAGPIYWLWHNWAIYGNALEFLTGPNSARGLYLQNRANLGWSQVFVGNPLLDLGVMLVAVTVCAGPIVMTLSVTGLAKSFTRLRREIARCGSVALLGVPFVFHVWSLDRGEIQVFPLSAFGLLNVRYGLPSLLAVAFLVPAAVLIVRPSWRRYALVAVAALVAAQYLVLISDGADQLAVYQEGYRNGINSKAARGLAAASAFLRSNPPTGTILMQTGSLGPLVPSGGLRFSRIIHEGTSRWHLLDRGLPSDVSTVILQDRDAVAQLIDKNRELSSELQESFVPEYEEGGIRIFTRRTGSR